MTKEKEASIINFKKILLKYMSDSSLEEILERSKKIEDYKSCEMIIEEMKQRKNYRKN